MLDENQTSSARVNELLALFAARLHQQQERGNRYEQCEMEATTRAAFESGLGTPLDAILPAHRDMMYDAHLELPLSL